jgi:hypothetical protein
MPQVTIKTGFTTPDGREECVTEYLCDSPDCPNIATDVLGCLKELGITSAVCKEHVGTQTVIKKNGPAPV